MTTVPTMRPEVELLLCCARTHMNAAMAERVRALLRNNLDWEYLLRTAEQHQVTPLLYWHLNTAGSEAIPKVAMNQLRGHFRMNAQRSLLLTRELLRILHLFETQGVPAIPLKGPILAASIYGNLSLRQFVDLDILVHKRDILKAKELLISEEYRPTDESQRREEGVDQLEGDPSPYDVDPQEVAYLQPQCYTFVRAGGRIRVDLQWRIARIDFSFSLDSEHVWEHVEPARLAGTTAPTFPPEQLFLILCAHGEKHLWEKLKWICDIAELISVYRTRDWGRVVGEAGRQGSKRRCALGLFLANDLLGAPLAAEVRQKIHADPVVRLAAAQVRKNLFAGDQGRATEAERLAFYLRMKDRWQDRVRYRFHFVCQYLYVAITPNAKDRAFLPLPWFLSYFYYVLRPIRLCGEYRLNLWRRSWLRWLLPSCAFLFSY